jgi:hypothetical protein
MSVRFFPAAAAVPGAADFPLSNPAVAGVLYMSLPSFSYLNSITSIQGINSRAASRYTASDESHNLLYRPFHCIHITPDVGTVVFILHVPDNMLNALGLPD